MGEKKYLICGSCSKKCEFNLIDDNTIDLKGIARCLHGQVCPNAYFEIKQKNDVWISVKDELPKHEQVVDVWMIERQIRDNRQVGVIFYEQYSGADFRPNFFFQYNYDNETTIFLEENKITHWMPRPVKPNSI